MPHQNKRALQALINDPDNWMQGEVAAGPAKALLGAGQALPTAKDAMQMLLRLKGSLSRTPTAAPKLFSDVPMNQSVKDMMHPSAMQMQEKMFQQANPIFKRMQAAGMFDRFGRGK